MRILFLEQFSSLGGAQRSLLELLPAVRRANWEAHVGLPNDGPLAARLREQGALIHTLPLSQYSDGRKHLSDAARFLRDVAVLSAEIRKLDGLLEPAVLYVNGPRLMPAVWRAGLGRPVIFHSHNYVSIWNGKPLVAAALHATRATVLAATRFVAHQWGARARVIYGGVDGPPPDWRRAARASGPRIGLIGRIEPDKRQKEFVLAAAELTPEMPDAEFILCGDARQGDEASLRYKREVLAPAPASLKYLGWCDDVYEVLSALDLLVMPSRCEGGVPYVLLDAFSAGVPVLASPVGDLAETIRDGENGFLLHSASPSGIARRLRELLSMPERLVLAAGNAHRLWRQRFTAERFRQEMWEVILTTARRN
jgi:glycosyltransferase involved in cell wall biosynthesis